MQNYSHGQDLLLLERRDLLRILYNGLPDKSLVRLGCKVRDIVEDADGVEVTLDDGTVERGDMVIGCDGVHSIVREKMWDLSNREVPGSITVQEKTSLVTRWKCLVGVGPPTPELGTRDMTVVHHDRYSFLFLTQPDKLFFFVFFRLDEEFRWPERRWYSTADADKLAASVSDHPVCESLVFGEVWKKKLRGALISVEEGVFKHWSHGRVVLAGDSVHKMTPNIALGGNSAMESVAALCNHIQRTAVSHQGRRVSRETLRNAFEKYQLEREGRMKEVMELSAFISRVQAMDGLGMKLVAKFVLPYQAHHKSTDQMGALIKTAPKLDYLPVDKSFARGRLMWEDEEEKTEGRQQELLSALLSRAMMYLAGGVTVLAVIYSVLF